MDFKIDETFFRIHDFRKDIVDEKTEVDVDEPSPAQQREFDEAWEGGTLKCEKERAINSLKSLNAKNVEEELQKQKKIGELIEEVKELDARFSNEKAPILFFREGDYWLIGKVRKEKRFIHRNGFQYIKYLLERPGQKQPPLFVYHGGDPAQSEQHGHREIEEEGLDVPNPAADLRLNKSKKREFKQVIDLLEEKRVVVEKRLITNPNRADENELSKIENQIASLSSRLSEGSNAPSSIENCRSNVTKQIKRALTTIIYELPEMEEFLSSIKTGYFCLYDPDQHPPITWKLKS